MNGELISKSKCKPLAAPQYAQTCIQFQTNFNHPADYTSTENLKSREHLINERQLSTEQIGLETKLSFENLVESETYQELVFLPGSTIDQPVTWEQLNSFPHTQSAAIAEQPTDELLELAFWDYRTLPTSEIRQGELNTPVIGKFTT